MSLSPHEQQALTTLEERFRTEDPALAALLAPAQPLSVRALLPLSVAQVLQLVAALTGLAVVGALAGERLGLTGLGALSCAAVVPWLVGTARSVSRRRRTARAPGAATSRMVPDAALPLGGRRGLTLAVVLFPPVLAALPPVWRAVAGLVLVFVVLPVIVLRVAAWVERRGTSR